jgi:hypothetical protein
MPKSSPWLTGSYAVQGFRSSTHHPPPRSTQAVSAASLMEFDIACVGNATTCACYATVRVGQDSQAEWLDRPNPAGSGQLRLSIGELGHDACDHVQRLLVPLIGWPSLEYRRGADTDDRVCSGPGPEFAFVFDMFSILQAGGANAHQGACNLERDACSFTTPFLRCIS